MSISYRGASGHNGVQTFVVRADNRLQAIRTAWVEAKTPKALARRHSARLVLHSLRTKRVPPQE
ncbi:hypothetical protein ACFWRZ_32055 [Streptomyces rubiginosohelvolus]|uniref:hypothetical protein n=1 Tax=Streptomyces rubiginosohelvolus TaxID=67362 RepID=UPI003647F726